MSILQVLWEAVKFLSQVYVIVVFALFVLGRIQYLRKDEREVINEYRRYKQEVGR